MVSATRRRFLQTAGGLALAGIAGCMGGNGAVNGGSGNGLTTVDIIAPEGTIYVPFHQGTVGTGVYEDEGIELNVEFAPFSSQLQAVTQNEINIGSMSVIPYVKFYNQGEDLVLPGWAGGLQGISGFFTRADSEFESLEDLQGQTIGVHSWGSSAVQSFQAVFMAKTGLNLREDFETTTAAPPALVGLLENGDIDACTQVSGLTISMLAQPEKFRELSFLNDEWLEMAGATLPVTAWFCYADWYEDNTDTVAALDAGSAKAVEYWRENTQAILEEHGEPAAIDSQAKIDVVKEWTANGQVFQTEADQDYIDSSWEFLDLMVEHGFLEQRPSQDEIIRTP